MLGNLDNHLIEMLHFYIRIPEKITDERDSFYADLAKSSAETCLELITKYNADPKNKYLKGLHSSLMTLVRGVEGFHTESVEKQHQQYGALQYDVIKYIEQKTKW